MNQFRPPFPQQSPYPGQGFPNQQGYPQQGAPRGAPDPLSALPDDADVREGADRTPWLPTIQGTYQVHALSVTRRRGYKGDNVIFKFRVVESTRPEVQIGSAYCLYRRTSGDQTIQRMAARWLCNLSSALLKMPPTDPTFNWQQTLGLYIALGEELANEGLLVSIEASPVQTQKIDQRTNQPLIVLNTLFGIVNQ